MRIRKEDTVAILVDVQDRLFRFIDNYEQLELNLTRLIQGLKVLNIPILVTEQYTKGLGQTIMMLQEALGDYQPIEKMTFSCCGLPDFVETLSMLGKKNVILMGIEAHVCVLQTAIDLSALGYQPILIEDCVSSRRANDKRIAVERARAEKAIVSTYESILFELCEVSGTEQFKQISKIVK